MHTRKRQTRKIGEEEEAGRLQKSADRNNTHKIWGFRIRIRAAASTKNIEIKKMDGSECQGMSETMKRWEEWTAEFRIKEIPYYSKEENTYVILSGDKVNYKRPRTYELSDCRPRLPRSLQKSQRRKHGSIKNIPSMTFGRELRNMANGKENGNDGVPGEAYGEKRKCEIAPIAKIRHKIKGGQAIRENWTSRNVSYIYKNKGGPIECGYMPIFPTQNIYKIWTGAIAGKLTKITHILTRNNQYGHKEGIYTIDAISKIDQYRTGQSRCRNPTHGHRQCVWRDKSATDMGGSIQKGLLGK